MQNRKYQKNYDISIDDDINELNPFKKEFQESLENEMDLAEMFNEELKHVQKLALLGKLNPKHKVTLIEWKELYPERFENFCSKLEKENRQKLLNFLD